MRFNKELYPKKALKKALSTYKKFGVFSLKDTNKYFQVKLVSVNVKMPAEHILNEFANYVLAESTVK